MKSLTTLIILLGFDMVSSFAQTRLINCTNHTNTDNSISISADSHAYGEYTLKFVFTSLSGYTVNSSIWNDIAMATVDFGQHEVLRLTPVKSAQIQYMFGFYYVYFPGVPLRRAPDSSYIYLLPAKEGKRLRIFKVFSISERLDLKQKDSYIGTGFEFKMGDTICASRAGVVYECSDEVKEGETRNTFFKRGRNNIAIQHKDYTMSDYDITAPIHLLVSLGDFVYPGQPLAVFNKESERYYVLLSTYYVNENKVIADKIINNSLLSSYLSFLPTHFYTGDPDPSGLVQANQVYTVHHPADIIKVELSKKEKKKLGF